MGRFEFPAVSAESAGIPSGAVESFIDRLGQKGLCMHGFLLVRGGKNAAEGYYAPFDKDRKHRMYSISKTFVSAAVGILIGEGQLSLSDRVADFFPEKCPDPLHPLIEKATVRDLLMMTTPFSYNTYGRSDPDWVKTFFHAEPSVEPGSIFSYNTAATVVLNAIVEKLSGELLVDYLYPRLFEPIGFSDGVWCIKRPEGGSWGGSGMQCTLRDLAKFAHVFLNNGKFDGKQLIPEWYVREATAKQADSRVSVGDMEERFGYGYQIWRTRENGFAFLGMGGQLALCLPEKDLILCTVADVQHVTGGASAIADAFWTCIYPHLCDGPLPENPEAHSALKARAEGLSLLLPEGAGKAPDEAALAGVSGVEFEMERNPMGMKTLRFDMDANGGSMHYENKSGEHRLDFSFGKYTFTKFPEPGYFGGQIGRPGGLYDCAATAVWENGALLLQVYVIDDYFGSLKAQFSFGGGSVSVLMTKAAEWFLDEYSGFALGHSGR